MDVPLALRPRRLVETVIKKGFCRITEQKHSHFAQVLAWLQLIRPPNLYTVPGDPLAGYLLVCTGSVFMSWHALPAMITSILLYISGLMMNDWVDRRRDREHRAHRPLPSGRAKPGMVMFASLGVMGAGILLAGLTGWLMLYAALALAVCIVGYNILFKRVAVLGPLVMGSCRALSVLLGGAAAGNLLAPSVLLAALIVLLYVASVTHLARRETQTGPMGLIRWLPTVMLIIGLQLLQYLHQGEDMSEILGSTAAYLFAVILAIHAGFRLGHASPSRSQVIGYLLSGLMPMQAAFAITSGHGHISWISGLALLAAWPLSRQTSKRFYAS